MQASVKKDVVFSGVGLHSGKRVNLRISPLPAHSGIWFRRGDMVGSKAISASYDLVPESRLCTKLVGHDGAEVSTIEHLMAAFAGCGIYNAMVELDGPEVPILDGSSAPFVREILKAGIVAQDAPVQAIEVLKPVRVAEGEAWVELRPADELEMDYTIDFEDAAIGFQNRRSNLANGHFVRELCDSRTFCRQSDVEMMKDAGLALGGSYENAVVVHGSTVLNPGGFRHSDEAVRHKMLDALGDLFLAGGPIIGRYVAFRAGHMLTNRLLRTLFSTPGAMRWVDCTKEQAERFPGVGVRAADLAHVA